MLKKWWIVALGTALSLSLTAGCGAGAKQIARKEMDKYSMKSYKEGNFRQRSNGTTLNSAMLKELKSECLKRGIRLTHETYSEGFEGNLSYSYFINGDARHFVIVHIYPSEQERIREISEMYGLKGMRAASGQEASVISERGKAAMVYASSRLRDSTYMHDMKASFDQVLDRMNASGQR